LLFRNGNPIGSISFCRTTAVVILTRLKSFQPQIFSIRIKNCGKSAYGTKIAPDMRAAWQINALMTSQLHAGYLELFSAYGIKNPIELMEPFSDLEAPMSTKPNFPFATSSAKVMMMFSAVVLVAIVGQAWAADSESKANSPKTPTSTLVRMALQSELADKSQERDRLLKKAVEQSPNDSKARWYSNQIQEDDIWMSLDEVEQSARDDKRLILYVRMRDAAGNTVEDQAALARWCRKNKLKDQQRVQWMRVLALQPDNAEAIEALDLRAYHGMLLTPAEIAQLKAQVHEVLLATDYWTPIVKQWQKAIQNKDEAAHAKILEEVRAIHEPCKLMALDLVIRQRLGGKKSNQSVYRQVSEDMVAALKEMPGPSAAESLARYAVFSPFESVNTAASAALKIRPIDHYVPLLLSWLAMPIESNFVLTRDADGRPIMQQTFFREGPLFNVALTELHSTIAPPNEQLFTANGNNDIKKIYGYQRARSKKEASEIERGFIANADSHQKAIDRFNDVVAEQNGRVQKTLNRCTEVELESDPSLWWDWWIKYNDLFIPGKQDGKKPTLEYLNYSTYQTKSFFTLSCFAPGTKVWTLTGQRPIEQIKPGDRVLSQDVETGELQYKPVLMLTINPAGHPMKIEVGSETITSTPGHPMWSVGEGWRLARLLTVGERLHSLSGGIAVKNVEKAPSDDQPVEVAYNLIVADFSTYFVGKQGILVHDNTLRKPTCAVLPGYIDSASTPSEVRPLKTETKRE
jgi:hypothetical protein